MSYILLFQASYIHIFWGVIFGVVFPLLMELMMIIEYIVEVSPLQIGPAIICGTTATFYLVEFDTSLAGTHHLIYRTSLTIIFASIACYAWFGSLVNRPIKIFAPPDGGE